MKKLFTLIAIALIMTFNQGCEKKEDIIPQKPIVTDTTINVAHKPNYTIFLTIDNVSNSQCKINVTYGSLTNYRGIFLQTETIPLNTYGGNVCPPIKYKPTKIFSVYSDFNIFFKFSIVDSDKEMAIDSANYFSRIIGTDFTHIMTSSNDSIEFIIKQK